MEVRRVPVKPVEPPPTWDIVGLSEDEIVFLRDLVGKFKAYSVSQGPKPFHTKLYEMLFEAAERQNPRRVISEHSFSTLRGDSIGTIVATKRNGDAL